MSDKFTNDTIARAKELGELYVGTVAGKVIDYKVANVEQSLKSDIALASVQVLELAKTCDIIEENLNA